MLPSVHGRRQRSRSSAQSTPERHQDCRQESSRASRPSIRLRSPRSSAAHFMRDGEARAIARIRMLHPRRPRTRLLQRGRQEPGGSHTELEPAAVGCMRVDGSIPTSQPVAAIAIVALIQSRAGSVLNARVSASHCRMPRTVPSKAPASTMSASIPRRAANDTGSAPKQECESVDTADSRLEICCGHGLWPGGSLIARPPVPGTGW